MGKRAFITGLTGQTGSYLAELLLGKGYEVHGTKRRSSSPNTARIDHIFDRVHVHYGDLTDGSNLASILSDIRPDEIYNLGGQSHVAVSFQLPEYTADVNALGAVRLLEAARSVCPGAKIYQASTSELFGSSPPPQNEQTPFHPRSPYAVSKLHAYWSAVNYREAYGMFAANGILFNHESPRRGETFVTRKITRALARIKVGLQSTLTLGNLNAKRDWGHARDYAEAMWLVLQQDEPDDFVIATGKQRSVWEFVQAAERFLGVEPGSYALTTDARYLRPAEVESLCGDARKAWERLGWQPTSTFEEIVAEMCDADLREASREAECAVY